MMHTIFYLSVLMILSLFALDSKSAKNVLILCMAFIFDIALVDLLSLSSNDLLFFSSRALFGLFLIRLTYGFGLSKIKSYVLYCCCLISVVMNIYLCFEKGNVFVYKHWETINLVLSEIMVATLILSNRGNKMFNKFKLWLYGAVAAIGMALIAWVKILSKQKETLQKEVKIAENNIVVLEKVQDDRKELDESLAQAKKEAEEVQHENNEKTKSRVRPNGKFGDKRL